MSDRVYNALFLCTGNTARSILAESILQKTPAARFRAFSAGSQPKGQVNPFALKVLRALDYDTHALGAINLPNNLSLAGRRRRPDLVDLSNESAGLFFRTLELEAVLASVLPR